MKRIRITGRGIYGAGGELPLGTELSVASIPRGWESRCEIVGEDEGKCLVVAARPNLEPLSAPPEDIAALRKEYQAKMGKRPFMGWDVETLRQKMAEAAPTDGQA